MNRWFGPYETRFPVVPLREHASLGTGHTPSRDVEAYWQNCTIPWVTVEDIRANGVDSFAPLMDTRQKISQLGMDNSAAVLHPAGAVMLSRTASIGFSCVIGRDMATTQAFVTWTPHKRSLNSNYLLAVLRSMREYYFAIAYGATHLTIYFPDIKALRVPLPPLKEQAQIATFLDYETTKIDGLIEKQQQLIALLKEKRQAVISHAVTKGLNPDAPMRDCGIEWLGDVPAHWEVKRLGHLGYLQNGLNIGGEAFGSGDPFVSYGDVYNNAIVPNPPIGLVKSTADDQMKYNLKCGDVLFTRTSETADDIGVASTCLQEITNVTFAGFLIRFRPTPGKLNPSYSLFLFRNQGIRNFWLIKCQRCKEENLSQRII